MTTLKELARSTTIRENTTYKSQFTAMSKTITYHSIKINKRSREDNFYIPTKNSKTELRNEGRSH